MEGAAAPLVEALSAVVEARAARAAKSARG